MWCLRCRPRGLITAVPLKWVWPTAPLEVAEPFHLLALSLTQLQNPNGNLKYKQGGETIFNRGNGRAVTVLIVLFRAIVMNCHLSPLNWTEDILSGSSVCQVFTRKWLLSSQLAHFVWRSEWYNAFRSSVNEITLWAENETHFGTIQMRR